MARRAALRSATSEKLDITVSPLSIHDQLAYKTVLDCDVIFSCVDRPVARDVLNFVAQSHLIPVIDGGVAIEMDLDKDRLFSAHWRAHIVSPYHQCLRCNGQYDTSMVVVELDGSLDDPNYVSNMPQPGGAINLNVFPFSVAVAAMETNLMLRYLLALEWWPNIHQLDYQFVTAETRHIFKACVPSCSFPARCAKGDEENPHYLVEDDRADLWSRFLAFISRLLRRSIRYS